MVSCSVSDILSVAGLKVLPDLVVDCVLIQLGPVQSSAADEIPPLPPNVAGRLNIPMGCCACEYASTLLCLKTHVEEPGETLYVSIHANLIYQQKRMI